MRGRFFFNHLLLFLVPVMVPVLLLGILSGYVMNHQVRQEIDLRNLEKVQSLALKAESTMSDLEQINLSLSHNPAITVRLKSVLGRSASGISADDYVIVNAIIDLLYSSTNYNVNVASFYVYLTNSHGQFISSTNRFSSLSFFHDTSWFSSYSERIDSPEVVWTEFRTIRPFSFLEEPIKVLTIYRKIFSSGKVEADGVLVLNVYVHQINRSLDSLLSQDGELLWILDAKQQLLFHSGEKPTDVTWGDETVNIDGKSYRYYVKTSELQPWEYRLLIPIDSVYAAPTVLTRLTLLLVLLTLGIGIIISSLVANHNYRNIKGIVETIQLAKEGKDLPKLPSAHSDVYSYIVRNLISSFIQKEYLRIQLSERRYHMRTLELLALQSQLNPHFLFNTMETIYWKTLALTGKPNEATAMIEQLSDILHYALNSDERLVSLQEEIEITKAYLHIQHVRYKDAFTVIWDVPPSLDHISVLRLLLQPLVENSIYHGIRGLDRPAQITIKVTEKESHVRIAIIDDGRGMDQVHLEAVRKSLRGSSIDRSTHIGLMNTNKRLQLQYGKTCKLHLYSKPNRGTCIIIKIPNPGLNTEIS